MSSVSILDMLPVLVPFLAGTLMISSVMSCSARRTIQTLTERISAIELRLRQEAQTVALPQDPTAYYYSPQAQVVQVPQYYTPGSAYHV